MHKKYWVIIVLLLFAIIYSFSSSKAKYVGKNVFHQLNIPYDIGDWKGRDTLDELNLDKDTYRFIDQVIDREYVNINGDSFFFTVLDAGNFHSPKVCCRGQGFNIRDLGIKELRISDSVIEANNIFVNNKNDGFLLIYWMCIDKKIVDWTEQKIKQLWYSLINKKRAGLMVRIDIPCNESGINEALISANEFLLTLKEMLPLKKAEFIFGKGSN